MVESTVGTKAVTMVDQRAHMSAVKKVVRTAVCLVETMVDPWVGSMAA